jgi:CheY-like chemotaxis protein
MVTAYGREEALNCAKQCGVVVSTVLTKPASPSTLLEAIGEALHEGIVTETRVVQKAESHGQAMAQLNGARVLLVEDNDMNQELALELFEQANMEVVVAHNGQEALDILGRDARFDGVMMDCQMPVMDGYTATREIRKNPDFQHIPVIAMTANAMTDDREKVLEAGMCDHIAKPLDVGEMFTTMAKWIQPTMAPDALLNASKSVAILTGSSRGAGIFGDMPLPGIDTRFGLATALNKESLYRRFLLKFRDRQGNFADLFAKARAGSDITAAQRCVHTLRSTAATVGAKRVQEAAERLEQACRQQAPDTRIDDLLRKVQEELQPVVDALQALGSEDTNVPVPPSIAIDAEHLSALRKRLTELLNRGDSVAIDLCNEHEDQFRSAYPAQWTKILDSVRGFDFESALALIQPTTS